MGFLRLLVGGRFLVAADEEGGASVVAVAVGTAQLRLGFDDAGDIGEDVADRFHALFVFVIAA
jgi:hypothetical protein